MESSKNASFTHFSTLILYINSVPSTQTTDSCQVLARFDIPCKYHSCVVIGTVCNFSVHFSRTLKKTVFCFDVSFSQCMYIVTVIMLDKKIIVEVE